MKYAIAIILFLAAIFALTWLYREKSLQMDEHFSPREEAVRHETFEKSAAYQQGMVQELQAMQIEYIRADKDGKDAIASIMLSRVASFEGDLPEDLHAFIDTLKQERGLQ